MGYAYNIADFNKDFFQVSGLPNTPQNQQFLSGWEGREGAFGFNYNPLATMQGGYGGTPGTNGIMSYPDAMAGAKATWAALNNGRYQDIVGGLKSGTPQDSYASLGTWSGGGYTSIPGYAGGSGVAQGPDGTLVAQGTQNIINAPQADAINQQQGYNALGIANSSLLASQNAAYAQQETGFQQSLLQLSQLGLGIEQGALQRQEVLDPKLRQLQQQQFGLQGQSIAQSRADITRQGKANIAGTQSGEAAGGNLFTSGGRSQLSNVRADLASALKSNTMQSQNLGITEKQAALGYKEQISALKDEEKNLGIQAARYGISKEELQARLKNSLQNINAGNISTILGFQQQGIANIAQLAQLYGTGLPQQATIGGVGAP